MRVEVVGRTSHRHRASCVSMLSGAMIPSKKLSSCDACRNRKVRCLKEHDQDEGCIMCRKRGERCHYSKMRIRKSAPVGRTVVQPSPTADRIFWAGEGNSLPQQEQSFNVQSPRSDTARTIAARSVTNETALPTNLGSSVSSRDMMDGHFTSAFLDPPLQVSSSRQYIDELLSQPRNHSPFSVRTNDKSLFTADDQHVGSSAIAFYSEKSMSALSKRLGHDRVSQLIATIECKTAMKMNIMTDCDPSPQPSSTPHDSVNFVPLDERHLAYIESYFEEVHPVYPFLNKDWFLEMINSASLEQDLTENKPLAALFYTVLALGCMYCDGGAFEPGKGCAWELFSRANALFADVILSKKVLLSLQALCAMTVYAVTAEGFRYEGLFIREAARAAAALSKKHFDDPRSEHSRQATFWVIYYLEKEYSFHSTLASVICDDDVSCPLPCPPPTMVDGLDWIRAAAIFARILSKAYVRAFSISATLKSREELFREIDYLRTEADSWLRSLPEKFQPSQGFRSFRFNKPGMLMIALRIHFMYYGLIVSLCRLTLHLSDCPSPRHSEAKAVLLLTARAVAGLLHHIPHEPYTPMISLVHMPLMDVFILFDYVVHNPLHPETRNNLVFLDVAAGYFSRLELVYASRGSPFGSQFSEFATIAHDYVRNQDSRPREGRLCHTIDGNAAPTSRVQNKGSTSPVSRQNDLSSSLNTEPQYPSMPEAAPSTLDRDWPFSSTIFDIQGIHELAFPLDEESLFLESLNWK